MEIRFNILQECKKTVCLKHKIDYKLYLTVQLNCRKLPETVSKCRNFCYCRKTYIPDDLEPIFFRSGWKLSLTYGMGQMRGHLRSSMSQPQLYLEKCV